MLASARNDDSGFAGHAPLDDATRELTGDEVRAVPRPDDVRSFGERLRQVLEQGGAPQLLRRGLNRLASPWVESEASDPRQTREIVRERDYAAGLYDAFTPPSRRGHGAFDFVLDHLFAKLQFLGARVVSSYVRSDDPRGQRSACVRLRPIGSLIHIRLNGRAPLVFGGSGAGLPTLVRHPVDDEAGHSDDRSRRLHHALTAKKLRINSAISGAASSSAKWPASRRCTSASGRFSP